MIKLIIFIREIKYLFLFKSGVAGIGFAIQFGLRGWMAKLEKAKVE